MITFNVTAYVLKSYPFGESHKIVQLFSKEKGKLKVVVHGIRKTKSKYGSTFEPLNEVSLLLSPAKGSDLYHIKDFSLISSCHLLREDFKTISQLYYLLEFLDQFIQEGHCDEEVYLLLNRVLALAKEESSQFYILLHSFEMKSLKILGFLSEISRCSQCGMELLDNEKGHSVFVSVRSGWIFCHRCFNSVVDKKISLGTFRILYDLQQVDFPQLRNLKIDHFFKNEVNLSIEKLMISILGKSLNTPKWLAI